MLNSIILSMTIMVTPSLNSEVNSSLMEAQLPTKGVLSSIIEKTGKKRGDNISFHALEIKEIGKKRGDNISFQALEIKEVGKKRGDNI